MKNMNPAINTPDDEVLAGCDTALLDKNGKLFLSTMEDVEIGSVGKPVKHRKVKTATREGDIIFGCCADIVIRDGKLLYPEEDWFYGKNRGTEFSYKIEQPITFTEDMYSLLPEGCKFEFTTL